MSAEQKLTETKTAMLLHTPFFASLLLDMMKIKLGKFPNIFPPGNETMATNGKVVWVDSDFIQSLKLPEAVFVMCHEVGHAMWQHMGRGKEYKDKGLGPDGTPFNPRVWNMAGDYVINDMLVQAKVGKMPKIGLHDVTIATMNDAIDDVYIKLMKQLSGGSGKGQGKGEGGGDAPNPNGNQGPDGTPDGTLDTHILETTEDSEVEWKRAVKTAADAAKAMGHMPAGLERFVENLLRPTVPWWEKLRTQFVRAIGRDAKNWNKLHRRRYVTQGVIMPAYKGFGCGTVVFVIDTSGSMSDPEIGQGLGEADAILTDCNPEQVILIGCDANVESVTELGAGDTLVANAPACTLGGGGGTSFVPPFKWLEEQNIRPDCLVYFTDMGGRFPDWDPGYPVIWCSTTGANKPDTAPGEVIMVELSNE